MIASKPDQGNEATVPLTVHVKLGAVQEGSEEVVDLAVAVVRLAVRGHDPTGSLRLLNPARVDTRDVRRVVHGTHAKTARDADGNHVELPSVNPNILVRAEERVQRGVTKIGYGTNISLSRQRIVLRASI